MSVKARSLDSRIDDQIVAIKRQVFSRDSNWMKSMPEPIDVSRPRGVRMIGQPARSYDFGNAISRPAIVENGIVKFV